MKQPNTTLQSWEEIVGRYQGTERNDSHIIVHLEELSPLSFPLGSSEASILEEELEDVESGTKVGILRSDMPEKPLLVRVVKENQDEGGERDS